MRNPKVHRPAFDPSWPGLWQTTYATDEGQIWDRRPAYGWEARTAPILEQVAQRLSRGSKLIDVASCQGNMALMLVDSGYDVTWNDLRSELEGYVRAKDPSDRLSYLPGNIFDLADTHPGDWDGVIATEIIEHVAHPDEMLRALGRLVRPGGFVFMSTPNGHYFRNKLLRFSDFEDTSQFEERQFMPDADGHIFALHQDEIERLARAAGLEVADFRTVGNPLTSGHIKLGRLHSILPPASIAAVERATSRLPDRFRDRIHRHSVFVLRRTGA